MINDHQGESGCKATLTCLCGLPGTEPGDGAAARPCSGAAVREAYMSKREEYEAKTEALLGPIAEANGVSIYDVEYVKEGSDYYLRAFIDKQEGVSINDCENVSRALSDALDREDFIGEAYVLEVSSPGLGRTLKKDKHLQSAIGEKVEIRLFKPIDKCKEFSGVLDSFDTDSVTILEGDGARTFRRTEVALIRLAIDF